MEGTSGLQHVYFVSYAHTDGSGVPRFGMTSVTSPEVIDAMVFVEQVAKVIEDSNGIDGVTVLGFQHLRTEQAGG